MARPGGYFRPPRTQRGPVSVAPEIQRSAPARRPIRPTGVFAQPVDQLTRPVSLRPVERKLPPPAQIPAFPVKQRYTAQEQATIVHGTEKAAHGVNRDELLAHPVTRARLEPYFRVKAQQEAAANREYAKAFGVTPQQSAQARQQVSLRSQALPKPPAGPSTLSKVLSVLGSTRSGQENAQLDFAKRLYTGALQPYSPNPTVPSPRIPLRGALGLGTLSDSLAYDAARNTRIAGDAGQAISRSLRQSSKDVRSGSGGSAIAPAFLRSPLADVLLGASKAAPVATRLGAGAANDLGQYVLGAIPATAQLASQAVTQGPKAAVDSLVKGTLEIAKHPLDHPLFAAQLLHGGESAALRPVGALGRSGALGKGVQEAFSTERAPLAIGGPAAQRLVEYRHFSKDPLVKAGQALADRGLPRGPVVRYHGRDVVTRQAKDSKLASVLGRDTAGRLRSHGDFVADRANSVERANRATMQRELLQAMPSRGGNAVSRYFDRRLPAGPAGRLRGPRGLYRPEQGILGLVATGVVRSAKTFEADLKTRLAVLGQRARQKFDHPEERQANLANQQAIRNVLSDPKAMANAERIVGAGRDIAKRGRALTAEAVKQGALSPEAAARSPLFDYALTHMGAKYHTVDEHRALERQAVTHERTAAEQVVALKQAGAPAQDIARAQELHSRLRDYRIAVSGRHPELVKRHEAARFQVVQARRKAQVAAAEHARAEKARQRLVGAQSVQRGPQSAARMAAARSQPTRARGVIAHIDRSLADQKALRRGAKGEENRAAALKKADANLATAKARRQAAEAAHREARANVPGLPDIQSGLRHADGRFLSNDVIHAHMKDAGIPVARHGPQVSYLPHRPDITGRGSYHRAQALLRRDSLEGYKRTGAAFQKGITGSGHDLITEHLVRMGITTGRGAIGQFDQLVHDAGVKRHDGALFTPSEAELEAKNLSNVPGQPKLVPVRTFAGRTTKGQQELARAAQDPLALDPNAYGDISSHLEKAFLERTNMAKDRQARNVVLMPEDLVNRFQKHITATAGRSPLGTMVARAFRTAVLPFSVKWLTGNVVEAALRLAIIGANPLDYAAGRKVITQLKGRDAKTLFGREMMKQIIGLDAERAGTSAEVRSSLLGGLFYGEKGLTIHRDSRDFADSRLRVPAEALGGLGKTTVAKELGHTLAQVPEGIFALNRFLERQAQTAALGRYVRRDIQEFTKSWLKSALLQRTAVRQAARGLFDTAQQRDAAHFMDITLGQYSRFSPKLRAFIQTAAPFLPWYLNSARFIFWTLPVGHPAKTAALNAAEVAFHDDWVRQHKDLPPGELKSTVPYHGGQLDLARFTPFGVATAIAGGDLSTIFSPVLPQIQGVYHATQGQDPFGRPMQVPKTASNPKGKPTVKDEVKSIGDQILGSFFPGYAPAERVAQHGETPYSNSSLLFGIQTKPDSSHGYSGLERWLNPFRPVYLKPKKVAAGTSSGWGRSSGPSSGWGGSSVTTSGWGG